MWRIGRPSRKEATKKFYAGRLPKRLENLPIFKSKRKSVEAQPDPPPSRFTLGKAAFWLIGGVFMLLILIRYTFMAYVAVRDSEAWAYETWWKADVTTSGLILTLIPIWIIVLYIFATQLYEIAKRLIKRIKWRGSPDSP